MIPTLVLGYDVSDEFVIHQPRQLHKPVECGDDDVIAITTK